ncbi:TPA: response regulator [Vibrio vulnificus]|nr:response regulator [Vibrio vulnificus]
MINIIIVDDSNDKIEAILSGLPESIRDSVDIAKSKSSAQKAFAKKTYDVAFVDLALPRYDDGDPLPNEGANLVQEINEFDWFKSPKKILAITQHSELESEYSELLKKFGVTLHHHDGTGNIADIVKYQYETIAKVNQQLDYNYDVLIVVALDEEAKPILSDERFNWSRQNILGLEDVNIRLSYLPINKDKKKVALVILPRMGLVSSAITTSRVVNEIRPRYVLMPGICAGVEGEVKLGDIIVANPSWEWQTGKLKGDSFAIEPYQIAVNQAMVGRFEEMLDTSILDELWKNTDNNRPECKPICHFGPMVSGSSVISNTEKISELREQHRKLIGIEMEIFGVYAACTQSNVNPDFIGFKSVCDYGNEQKADNYHSYCSEISGKLCANFVEFVLKTDSE